MNRIVNRLSKMTHCNQKQHFMSSLPPVRLHKGETKWAAVDASQSLRHTLRS
ncbi:MAG: hypothetical protein ACJA2P_000884 [Rhodoferax sp.]|jgi:hypothetical protein